MEYLLELRRRLLMCFLSILFVFCVLCFFANPLYQVLIRPLLLQLPSTHLIATHITAPFLVPIKFAFVISFFILMPFFSYHIWAFVSPALYSHEKKTVWLLLVPSVLLFYLGMVFAYFIILPIVFHFFVQTTPVHVALLPDIGQYLSFALELLFAFGIAFEVPILVWVIVYFKIMTLKQLSAARRYVIVWAFIVGMLLTPPDVLSQILLAVPLCLLYELGLLCARWLPENKAC